MKVGKYEELNRQLSVIPSKKIPKCTKELNVKPETLKLLEENIRCTF